jgi:hypothetical protein
MCGLGTPVVDDGEHGHGKSRENDEKKACPDEEHRGHIQDCGVGYAWPIFLLLKLELGYCSKQRTLRAHTCQNDGPYLWEQGEVPQQVDAEQHPGKQARLNAQPRVVITY